MQVTLDVFSGRPNPSWVLSSEEEQELTKRLAGLPRTDRPPVAEGLGYRGFLITNPERKSGVPAEVRVCNGFVMVRNGEEASNALDLNGLERWFVEQAQKRGYADLTDEKG
jgi:hypothetical protein